mgnify:CR=1 FL=1
MRFFIDTAKVEDIKKANDMGVICGVTTNPSLIAKEGRDFVEVIKEIASIVDGPISGEVKATTVDAEGMIKEGREIAAIHPNGQRRGEFGQPGIRVSWAESHPPDGHHIHPALRQILLPLHDPGRLHKAGPGLCDERIAGSGFCFGNGPAAGKAPWDLAEQGDRDPQRPGDPLHQSEVHPAGGEQRTAAVHVPQRELLGQRAPRELLRAHEGRTGQ